MSKAEIWRYEKRTWPEINEAVTANKVVVIPIGSTEPTVSRRPDAPGVQLPCFDHRCTVLVSFIHYHEQIGTTLDVIECCCGNGPLFINVVTKVCLIELRR